ncbi:MAG TPA: SLC13 family permease [Anaerolineae bacterium]|nr:SLC13 family permease [Anaerolineae bacterium]
MTLSIVLLLIILAAAIVLFSWEQLPADVVAMGLLLVLILAGLLPPNQAFASFGSDTVIMIFGLLVLTTTLVHTGVVETAGRLLLRLTGQTPHRLLLVIMAAAATLSAFISNTATTALFMPITITLTRRLKLSASKLLMPLAFATILASSITLVSSSTNVVISGLIQLHGMAPLGMFEMTAVGLVIAVVGVLYMLSIGQQLIPDRGEQESVDGASDARPYLSEVVIQAESALVGKTLREARLGHDMDLTVLRVVRNRNRYLTPQADLRLEIGDKLLVKGPRNQLLQFALNNAPAPLPSPAPDMAAAEAAPESDGDSRNANGLRPIDTFPRLDANIQTEDIQTVEAILLPRSPFIGRTLRDIRLRQTYGLQVLGLNRHGTSIYRKLSTVRFGTGDQWLVQGPRAIIAELDRENVFRVIDDLNIQSPKRQRAPLTVAIFAGVLLIAALNLLPLAAAIWAGVLLVFITGCINPSTAYRTIEWKVLMVIGSMLALGRAMEYTGTAAFLAHQIIAAIPQAHPLVLLSVFFGLTMALTQPMSNQAAAAIVLPIALETALQLGLNPRAFAIMIAVGASCSFITPLEPACLIVYGPGRYKFMDFVKVGLFLTLLIYVIAIVMVPWLWPL